MEGYEDLLENLKAIKKMGFVKTHRQGNTGIGKTLEDLLEIKENNVPGPNHKMLELKSARLSGTSMLTLFTKSPLPKKANSVLLKKFGYKSAKGNDKKKLHSTVSATSYNTLKGKTGFKIDLKEGRIELVTQEKEVLGYWDKETLQKSFERKIPRLLYVKAENKGSGENEEFWFKEAWVLDGFNFKNFVKLVEQGHIVVDIRIGQYHDGRVHDHGTGFRVYPRKLELCFEKREQVM